MSRVDALDVVVTSVGGKVGMGATVATSTDTKGQVVNISGLVSGIAQTIHSGVDLASKGLQAVPGSMWAKGVPVVGSGLGIVGLGLGLYEGPKSQADYAGLVSNAAGFGAGVAVLMTAPVVATGLGILAIGAGGYQIYQSRNGTNSPSSPLSDYSFDSNYRANGYTSLPEVVITGSGRPSLESWTNVGILSAEYQQYPIGSAQQFAREIGESAPFGVNSLDSWTAAYQAAGGFNSDSFSGQSSGMDWTSNFYQATDFSFNNNYSFNNYTAPNYSFNFDYSVNFSDWEPVVIDLDGDGVEIKTLDRSTTYFDLDADGYKERTAWVGADDGLLVIDLNGDGQVTQSKEMAFGEWTTEKDTDLQALAKVFDSNNDGTFDSRDARFSEFRIWKDANSNGVADAGEMVTLQAVGSAANEALYWRCA